MMKDQTPTPPEGDVAKATSLTLLERVRGADPDAWQRLVHLYSP